MAKNKLKTTGDLRGLLLDTIFSVQDGTLDLEKARVICTATNQVNKNMIAEVRTLQVMQDLHMAHESSFGALDLRKSVAAES